MIQDENFFSCSPSFDFPCSPFLSICFPLTWLFFLFYPPVLFCSTSLAPFFFIFLLPLSISRCLFALRVNRYIVESGFRVPCAVNTCILNEHNQILMRQQHFHKSCSSLGWCQITRGALQWFSPITALWCGGGHKLYRQFPHLNGLISGVGGCWPK